MPAAAVIPAPIAYINVAAVKKLVVGFQGRRTCHLHGVRVLVRFFLLINLSAPHGVGWGVSTFTLKKLECSKQAFA